MCYDVNALIQFQLSVSSASYPVADVFVKALQNSVFDYWK